MEMSLLLLYIFSLSLKYNKKAFKLNYGFVERQTDSLILDNDFIQC